MGKTVQQTYKQILTKEGGSATEEISTEEEGLTQLQAPGDTVPDLSLKAGVAVSGEKVGQAFPGPRERG